MNSAGGDTFVGRGPELAVMADRTERAWAGRAQVVVVEGPPGVGKSALLREAVRRSGGDGTVLRAGGEEAEQLVAFGILDQLVRSAEGALPPLGLTATTEPAVAGSGLLGALGALGRCVLLVDDAQWADRTSVQALVFALRRLGRARVLTIVATRDGAAADRARLTRLADGPDGARVPLDGLDVPELVALGDALGHPALPRRAAQRLHDHTGGNPLHARALLDEVDPARLRAPDGALPPPSTYAQLVAERLDKCPAAVRELVRAAAVLGERCSPAAARQLAEGSDRSVPVEPATIDEAVAARLLVLERTATGPEIAFPHGLVRAAVYHDLDLVTRVALHDRAAAQAGDPDTALGHRVAACLDRDPVLAADLVRRAGELESRDQSARAGGHLLVAARLHPSAGARSDALFRAVGAFVVAGEGDLAESLRPAVTSSVAGAARDHALALLDFERGRPVQAEELLRRAWDRADAESERDLRARVAALLCRICYLQLRHDEAIDWGVRARDLDPRHAAPLATSLALAGRDPGSVASPDPAATGTGPEVALARGTARLFREELADAHSDLTDAVRVLRESGQFQTRLHATGYLVLVELRTGHWAEAARHAAEAVSLARDAEQDWVLARLHSYAAMVAAVRGESGAAASHRDAAHAAAVGTGLGLDRAAAAIAAAHVAAAAGEHAEVVRLLGPFADPVRLGRLGDPGVSQWPCLLAESLVALDRVGEAEIVLEPYERRSSELGRRLAASAAARVRGRVEGTRDRDAALVSMRRAVALADGAGGPVEAALARVDLGAALRRSGRRRLAADELRRACAALERMGAGPAAARCARELDACGLHPAPRGRAGVPRLTPREQAVARLAADGLTNPQVAAELTVSLNTVEFHLRNVFGKLGISARGEIAAHLE